ncbi:hypothetical protein WR25_19055 [Diploscapter pachys]|uniref:Splicing factor Cactin n=1 Tax=Diploscapter pachys TaxID=2018661 RepID=A0A2A2JK00_9BILA|nr:hypothetical protein WR25_19055 [Diploscapter pachys]
MGKHKKERRRSRSRDRDSSSKKQKKRQDSSASSSESSSDDEKDKKLDSLLAKQRAEKKRLKQVEKQRKKELEAPEEKRERRLKKKAKKEQKRLQAQGIAANETVYDNWNNPFNDNRLTDTFIWGKKLEKEGKADLSKKTIIKEIKKRTEKNYREMEDLKRARDARAAAKEDMDMIQRDEEKRMHGDWDKKEMEFQLQQAKFRTQLRIEQNRAKPIDLLYRYIRFGDQEDAKSSKENDFELVEPSSMIKGLTMDDYEDLLADIDSIIKLEGSTHIQFWNNIRTLIREEIKKLQRARHEREAIHSAVEDRINDILKGKSIDQLSELEKQIRTKIRDGAAGTDITFWETLLNKLIIKVAQTQLKELHMKMRKLKIEQIRQEQMLEVNALNEESGQKREIKKEERDSDEEGPSASHESRPMPKPKTAEQQEVEDEMIEHKLNQQVDVDALEDPLLDDMKREHKWRALNPEQLEYATIELYNRGSYSPTYGDIKDNMPGIEVIDESTDAASLDQRRQACQKKPEGLTETEAAMVAIARKGMQGDEAMFSVELPLETESYLWSDKYRPRKPTYLNRVQTGFDWNKYNQTHYDMDNPPPKIVQGYKFNIFYPDLLEKHKTPTFTVTSCDDPDFAIIRFKTGPPYEDVAFKVVNREWEVTQRNGYKCQFANGVFQLWFQFKRYRYRR